METKGLHGSGGTQELEISRDRDSDGGFRNALDILREDNSIAEGCIDIFENII